MNRRDFIKSTATVLLLPSLIVRPKVDLHRILCGFCDQPGDICRYDLTQPFIQGGNAIATDARIMAWIPTISADTSSDERAVPPMKPAGAKERECPLCYWESVIEFCEAAECGQMEASSPNPRGTP